jgi:hypothetical protein
MSDFAACFLFLIFIPYFALYGRRLALRISRGNVSHSDYTVFVDKLPADASIREVRDHFDRLYNLHNDDWTEFSCCFRKSLQSARPKMLALEETSNTFDSIEMALSAIQNKMKARNVANPVRDISSSGELRAASDFSRKPPLPGFVGRGRRDCHR